MGLETGLCRMKKGERAELTIDPKYGFGKNGLTSKGVPGDAKLVYDITLKSFERAKEGWQLDGDQKLEQSRYVGTSALESVCKFIVAVCTEFILAL